MSHVAQTREFADLLDPEVPVELVTFTEGVAAFYPQ
jgi:hypothetical protein